MRIHRAAAGLVAGAALLAGAAAPALAHDTLVSSSPRNGATVKALPKTITLTFTGALGKVKSASLVSARRSYLASVRLNPRNVKQILVKTRPGRPGSYVLKATYVSGDGHVTTAIVKFRVRR